MRRFFSLLLVTALSLAAMAQGKLTPQAQLGIKLRKAKAERLAARSQGHVTQPSAQQRMQLVLTLDEGSMAQTAQRLKAAGAEVRARLGSQLVVSLPTDSVEAVQRIEGVQRIDLSHKGKLKTDVARKETGVSQLNGPTLPAGATAYSGKGVTICLIDAGFDFQHPAFKDAQGRSRIKCVYLMGDNGGNKFTVDDPDLGSYTFPGSVYDTPELIATLTTDNDDEIHGTHTAGIAAGSLSPQGFGGMAPEADLVLVPLVETEVEGFDEPDSDGYFELALAFVSAYADKTDQPVVLSCSANSHEGPHDGTGTIPMAITEVSKHLVPVFSAGNEGGYPIHLYRKFTAQEPQVKTLLIAMAEDEMKKYDFVVMPSVVGYVRTGTEVSVQLSLKKINQFTGRLTNVWTSQKCTATAGCEEQMVVTNSEDEASLKNTFEGTIAVGAMEDENGRLVIAAKAEGGVKGLCLFELTVSGADGTEVDLWDELAGFGGVNFVGLPGYVDGDSDMSAGDWTCIDDVISVGAYCANTISRNPEGEEKDTSVKGSDDDDEDSDDDDDDDGDELDVLNDIAFFSSYGTSFNGVSQPLVCAPGVNVVSAMNHYDIDYMTYADGMQWQGYPYGAESGTSMSCPVVAGIVALWMQAKPDMTLNDVKDVISHTARNDSFTATNTQRWGYGKIDAVAGINYIVNGTEAIRSIAAGDSSTTTTYDLQGRRISGRPASGLYISNGRKVVLR